MPDVDVIAGGISGVATAYALVQESLSVALFEQHGLTAMASGWPLAGVRQSGRHPASIPRAMAAVEIWQTSGDELDTEVEYRQKGNMRLAKNESECQSLQRLVGEQRRLGFDIEFWRGMQAWAGWPWCDRANLPFEA